MEENLTAKIPAGINSMIKELVSDLHDVVSDLEALSQHEQNTISDIVPCADSYAKFKKETEGEPEQPSDHILFSRLIILKNRLMLLRTHQECVIRHIEKI